jgi:hypothetical protein
MFNLRQRSARFVPARYRFLLFGLTQSGITCTIAAAIATATFSPHAHSSRTLHSGTLVGKERAQADRRDLLTMPAPRVTFI